MSFSVSKEAPTQSEAFSGRHLPKIAMSVSGKIGKLLRTVGKTWDLRYQTATNLRKPGNLDIIHRQGLRLVAAVVTVTT
jgi:hypothetical protein